MSAASRKSTWSEYLMAASVPEILPFVLSKRTLQKVHSESKNKFCFRIPSCVTMAWRGRGPLWLGLLALMVAASSGVASKQFEFWLFKAVYTVDSTVLWNSRLQKPLPKRTFLHLRCPKWWAPPSNSCTATPEDTKRFVCFIFPCFVWLSGNKHHKTNKLAGISAVCRYTATEIPWPFHSWR